METYENRANNPRKFYSLYYLPEGWARSARNIFNITAPKIAGNRHVKKAPHKREAFKIERNHQKTKTKSLKIIHWKLKDIWITFPFNHIQLVTSISLPVRFSN